MRINWPMSLTSTILATLSLTLLISLAESYDDSERSARSAAARFIATKAARAAAARSPQQRDFAAAQRQIVTRAAAANTAANGYPDNDDDDDGGAYWAAVNSHNYDGMPLYKWNRYDTRSTNGGGPKRAGNRKFQTQGW
ncbi:Uncharacterised protein g1568 [Pycnogonum litorale]